MSLILLWYIVVRSFIIVLPFTVSCFYLTTLSQHVISTIADFSSSEHNCFLLLFLLSLSLLLSDLRDHGYVRLKESAGQERSSTHTTAAIRSLGSRRQQLYGVEH